MQSGILSKNIWKITMLLVFAAFVAAPYITLQGAVKGVRLWFNTVLPSMLPCIIISNLIINAYGRSFRYPWLYIIITGLFCGYPMGAKSCADLYGHDYKNACMTQFLLAVCNYSSPAFITGYCIAQTLIMKEHTLLILAILYIPVILYFQRFSCTYQESRFILLRDRRDFHGYGIYAKNICADRKRID